MKKLILILTFVTVGFPLAFSQDLRIGLRGGLNLSTIVGQDADGANLTPGVHVGPFVRVGINDMLFFQPELLLSTKGYSDKGARAQIDYKFRQRLLYLDLPLMAGINLTENFGFLLGLQPSFFLSAKYKYNYENNPWFKDFSDNNPSSFANVDLGLVLGLQYQMENGLDLGFRFNYGFPNAYDDSDFTAHNLNLMLSIGYSIGR